MAEGERGASPFTGRDTELAENLSRIALGDRTAFERLYTATSPHLFSMLLRILRRQSWAEEVLQDTFISVWQQAGRYQRAKSAPMTWLSSIARNAAIDTLRRRDNEAVALDEDAELAIADTGPGPLATLLASADQRQVRTCMDTLTGPQQQSLALAFFHGLSHAELAAHMAQPLGTVKTWVRRGLQALKACLGS